MSTSPSAIYSNTNNPYYMLGLPQSQALSQGGPALAYPGGSASPYGVPTADDPSSPYGNPATNPAGPYGDPYATTTPALNTSDTVNNSNFYNDQSIEYAQENQLEGEAQAQLGYYGPLQEQAQQQEETALQNLNAQPGYTPAQASQINVNYGQYNTPTSALQSEFLTPGEQSGILGDTSQPVSVAQTGAEGEGAMLNQYQGDLSGQLSNNTADVTGAATGLDTGLAGSQNFGQLNSAVNNNALEFNGSGPAGNEMTDAQVQQMETAAGTTVGNQYQAAEQQMYQNAAAQGNTSPLALAVASERLNQTSAAQAGDAETEAAIAAQGAQYSRAQQIEAQELGAAQTQAGLQANAGEFEQGQGQTAATVGGEAGIGAAEDIGNQGINVANEYGQESIGTEEAIAGQQYSAANTAEQEEAAREAALATNRQQTQTGVNQTQYSQGTGSAQMTAGGAENVGQTAIAGQSAYRSGVSQQQALEQQGGETAEGQQQTAASTLGSQLNTSEANAGAFKNNSPTLAGQSSQVIGAVGSLLDKGGIITEPTLAVIGEKHPEAVIPVGPRYRPKHHNNPWNEEAA
jgi:hypothetical protein